MWSTSVGYFDKLLKILIPEPLKKKRKVMIDLYETSTIV